MTPRRPRIPTCPAVLRCLLGLAALVALTALPVQAQAQDLAHIYRDVRFKAQAQRAIGEHGPRATPLPPEMLPLPPGAMPAWLSERAAPGAGAAPAPPALPPYEVRQWQFVRKLQRAWFKKTFWRTKWSYLGSYGVTPLDTTHTRELRARLQALFGQPTQTLAEQNPRQTMASNSPVQFEYWFVLNDTVPFVVTDTNGPYERGLIVATDQEHRDLLPSIRASFLGELMEVETLAPYVDYYYDREEKAWYRTGYDGKAYFHQRIPRPNLARGRPWIGRQ